MPLGLRRGSVTAILERHERLLRIEVDGIPCIAYPRLTGEVEVGDEVLVNEQARLLELGSGGFDVLHANLTRGLGLEPEPGAHVMALPYTPGQVALRRAEEDQAMPASLAGLPVVLCSLHSQVAPVCAALAGLRVAYVQVAGGALPVSLSDTVRLLKERGLLGAAVAVAPCLDGDVDCITSATGLAWASREHDAIVCALGPGIVGTGTSFGHGALSLAEAANTALALRGRPVLAVRTSSADPRERHRGVSHHTQTVLDLCLGEVLVAADEDGEGWEDACAGLPVVLCSLHSQVAPVCAALAGLRVAYVQVAGGALPVSLSDTVRLLKERGLLGAAVAVAPCLDGDVDCITSATGLAWASREHDAIVCALGPGIVGTGTSFGHGALSLAEAANTALALGGRPVLAVRTSSADPRERHRGVSHHTQTVLDLCLGEVLVAADEDGEGWADACAGLPLAHMGRGPEEDPAFFRAAFAAGVVARRLSG